MENKSDRGALVSAALLCKEPSPLIFKLNNNNNV